MLTANSLIQDLALVTRFVGVLVYSLEVIGLFGI